MMSLLAALLAVTLSPETPLGPDRIGAAANTQFEPAVAMSPHGMLVAWRDDRASVQQRASGPVYAARVDRSGELLDPVGIPLFPRDYSNMRIAWTGSDYVVAAEYRHSVVARRVSPEGLLGEIVPLVKRGGFVGFAANGKSMLVLTRGNWASDKPGPFMATLLDAKGATRKSFELSRSTSPAGRVTIVDGAYTFVFVAPNCDRNGCVRVVRITEEGTISTRRVTGIGARRVDAASIDARGNVLLVAADGDIEAAHVDTLTGVAGTFRSLEIGNAHARGFHGVWDGSSHIFVWQERPDSSTFPQRLRAVRVGADGKRAGAAIVLGPSSALLAAEIDTLEGRTVVAWNGGSSRTFNDDIVATQFRAGEELVPSTPLVVSRSGRPQTAVGIASDGQAIVAAVREGSDPFAIRANRVPFVERLVLNRGVRYAGTPSVTWVKGEYVVLWTEWGDPHQQSLMAQRMRGDGREIGEPIKIDEYPSNSEEPSSIASDGATVMIVWPCAISARILRLDRELRLLESRTIAPGAQQIASLILATPPPPPPPLSSPQVVWNGESFVVGWLELGAARFARLTHDLRLEDIGVFRRRAAVGWLTMTTVGRDVIAAWTDDVDDTHMSGCVESGVVGSSKSVRVACGTMGGLTMASTGNGPLLAWVDGSGRISARILPDGERFDVATNALIHPPSLAATKAGATIAYLRLASDGSSGGVPRVFLRSIDLRRE